MVETVTVRGGTNSRTRGGQLGAGGRKPLVGSTEPRIFTPPLRPLEPRNAETEHWTLGYDVIDFARKWLGMELYPWQEWLLVHLLELRPDASSRSGQSLRFRTVIVLVARQNGKSTISVVIALWFMYIWGTRLVIGTAQDLDVAEEIWQTAVDLVLEEDDDESFKRPDLARQVSKVNRTNGKQSLNLKTGERWKVKAANRKAGRSLSGDLILLDELREHQSWDAWAALSKTTMARLEALILGFSNAGDATSIVLRYLRKLAHAALGDPDGINAEEDPSSLLPENQHPEAEDSELEVFDLEDDDVGLFEWSAPPGSGIWDKAGWCWANPSLGFGISERAVRSAARTDPEWVFRTEVLCQWSSGALDGAFPGSSWEDSRTGDDLAADVVGRLCVDTSWDHAKTHVSLAGWRPDGDPQVEVIASRVGQDWVLPWLLADERSPAVKSALAAGVVVQAKGAPASLLIKVFEAGVCRHSPAHLECPEPSTVKVTEWGSADLSLGCAEFYGRVRAAIGEGEAEGRVWHKGQPLLDVAAANAATKPYLDSWVWDRRKSPIDIAPVVAATGALWGLLFDQPEPEPTPPAEPLMDDSESATVFDDVMSAGF